MLYKYTIKCNVGLLLLHVKKNPSRERMQKCQGCRAVYPCFSY